MISRRIFALGLAVALASCTQPGTSPTADWEGKTWYLWSVDGVPTTPGTMRSASLRFDAPNYRYGGFCNGVSGTYTYGPGTTLTLGLGASTLIGCPDPNEDVYFAYMSKVNSLSVDGIELVLTTTDAKVLRFRAPI